jgi:hypothetical protein
MQDEWCNVHSIVYKPFLRRSYYIPMNKPTHHKVQRFVLNVGCLATASAERRLLLIKVGERDHANWGLLLPLQE